MARTASRLVSMSMLRDSQAAQDMESRRRVWARVSAATPG
jgi:hypothetical protein